MAPGQWNSRGHFFGAAAEAMRRILVEQARRKGRQKRGGGLNRLDLDLAELPDSRQADDLLALNEALGRLEAEDPQAAELVKLRFFAGLSVTEAAEAVGISRSTAYEQWAYARAWLRCAMEGDEADAG
jgi:RNA polymerase sigma factor (TIGR02999 family)